MGVLKPVIKIEIRLASNGGSIRLVTDDNREFKSPLFPIPFVTAIATVMNGPHPHYNHDDGIFSCGFNNGQHSGLNTLALNSLSNPLSDNSLFDETL